VAASAAAVLLPPPPLLLPLLLLLSLPGSVIWRHDPQLQHCSCCRVVLRLPCLALLHCYAYCLCLLLPFEQQKDRSVDVILFFCHHHAHQPPELEAPAGT
jgi:hypothetical protein